MIRTIPIFVCFTLSAVPWPIAPEDGSLWNEVVGETPSTGLRRVEESLSLQTADPTVNPTGEPGQSDDVPTSHDESGRVPPEVLLFVQEFAQEAGEPSSEGDPVVSVVESHRTVKVELQWQTRSAREDDGETLHHLFLKTLRRVSPHVVELSVQRSDQGPDFDSMAATGFLVEPTHGYVVTTGDVLEGAQRVVTRFRGMPESAPRRADILGIDEETRIGLLRVGPVEAPAPQALDKDPEAFGQMVISICSDDTPKVGMIAGRRKNCEWQGREFKELFVVSGDMQTNQTGSLVANPHGKMVGILLPSLKEATASAQTAVNFALPMADVLAGVDRLVERAEVHKPSSSRRWIGIGCLDLVGTMLEEHLQLDGGVIVVDVFEDSPARHAGLDRMDVLVHWNGQRIKNRRHLDRLVRQTEDGEPVLVKAIRQGQPFEVSLTPASW